LVAHLDALAGALVNVNVIALLEAILIVRLFDLMVSS
jgi:hypothetical protein